MANKADLKRGYFNLTKEYLYIANDVRPFERKGVKAISMANLSGKGDRIKDKHKNFIKFLLVIIIYSYKKNLVFQLTHMPQ